MSKIKINKFAGITTNINEKQVGLNSLKDGRNFKVYPTYIKSDIHSYVERENLPTLLSGWNWETGIETVIVNDPHAINPIISQTIVEILIAKKVSSGVNYRQIYFKEKASTSWKVLQYDGKNGEDYASNTSKLSTVLLTSDFLNTSISGDVKFINDYGVLKIYFPHDCFWFGKLNRTIKINSSNISINEYYFDRLSERTTYDINNYSLQGTTTKTCADTKRLGIEYRTTQIGTANIIVSGDKAKFNQMISQDSDVMIFNCINQNTGEIINLPEGYVIYTFTNGLEVTIKTWVFYKYNNSTEILVHIDSMLIGDNSETFGSSLLKTTNTYTRVSNPSITFQGNTWNLQGQFFRIPVSNFISTEYTIQNGNVTIGESGFTSSTAIKGIIVTAVLDKKTEIIINFNNVLYTYTDNYALKVSNIILPTDINRRITNIKFYVKKTTDLDFELYQDYDLISNITPNITEFYFSEGNRTGIYLSQNIGFLFNIDKPKEYQVITSFRDIAIENEISLALTNYDYVNVYSCVVGGGNIQTDLFYPQNAINLSGISFAKGVIGINGRFLVATKTQCQIIAYREFNGTLLFESIETINVGIEMPSAMLKIENGALLLNRLGLFYTDGYKKNKLSEPINDIIENTYSDSKIYYNDILNEVYYVMLNNYLDNNKVLRYNIERGSWEIFNIVSLTNLQNLIITQEGKVNPIFLDSIYEEFSENFYNSELEFNKSSIGEINKVFWLNGIAIDYIGSNNTISFTMEIEYYQSNSPVDNSYNKSSKIISYTLPNTTERKTVYLPVRLDSRVPFNIIIPKLVSGNNYTIYEIEYDIETNEEELFT